MVRTPHPPILKIVFVLSLLLNLGFTALLLKRHFFKPAAYVPPPKLPYYLNRDKLFESMPTDSNAVVFLGNSQTQYYELAEFFPGYRVKNRGIHGDMLDKVLLHLSPIIQSTPKKIFIELGVNDIEQKVPADEFLRMYSRLVDTLMQTCPSAKIYIQSLLPVSDTSVYMPTYCSKEMNRKLLNMNVELRKLASEKKATYINLYDSFVLMGQLNPRYTVDGGHLSGEGYRLWTKLVQPFLAD